MEVLREVLGVQDKSKPGKMCFYGILGHDIKVHSFKGREVIGSQKGRSDHKNAHSKKPS
jgi:hypothetical protein